MPEDVQLSSLQPRRVATPFPLREKLKVADFVIDNDSTGSNVETRAQTQSLWRDLQNVAEQDSELSHT